MRRRRSVCSQLRIRQCSTTSLTDMAEVQCPRCRGLRKIVTRKDGQLVDCPQCHGKGRVKPSWRARSVNEGTQE